MSALALALRYYCLTPGLHKTLTKLFWTTWEQNTYSSLTVSLAKLTIPVDGLNENFYYEGRVYDANGALVLFNTDYDAFSFKTGIIKNL